MIHYLGRKLADCPAGPGSRGRCACHVFNLVVGVSVYVSSASETVLNFIYLGNYVSFQDEEESGQENC